MFVGPVRFAAMLVTGASCVLCTPYANANPDPGFVPFAFEFTAPGGPIPELDPDHDLEGRSVFPLTMVNSGIGIAEIFSLELQLTSLKHTNPDDMEVYLIDPFGETLAVMTDRGGDVGVNGITMIFNDAESNVPPDATELFSGRYKPQGPDDTPGDGNDGLSNFLKQPTGNNTWLLVIFDDAAGDGGSLQSWTLRGTGITNLLAVAPLVRNVSTTVGSTSFNVSNRSAGAMPWSGAVMPGSPWLRITSGASGVNGGIIFAGYDANPDPGPRTGTIRVSAPGATPPFVDVSVVQSGTAPPPQVTHFEFAPLPGPYLVNEPIPVTITAMNATNTAAPAIQTGFSGWVDLSTNSPALIFPTKFDMRDGMWTGTIKLDQDFADTFLEALSGGVTGQSNRFAITAPTATTGCIHGKVSHEVGYDPVGAVISVLNSNDSLVATTIVPEWSIIDPTQLYLVCGLPPSSYVVYAAKELRLSMRKRVSVAAGKIQSAPDLDLGDASKPPVLLVGGFLGSREPADSNVYPIITGLPGKIPRDQLHLIDFRPGHYVWRRLRLVLEQRFRPVEVPWDWRARINDDLVQDYLIDAINEAKKRSDGTEWAKVRVAAHSLGGLLVRHYIQGDLYQGDIESFAMVATPNQGAAILYYLWEGVDTDEPDRIAGDDLYSKTVGKIYKKIKKESIQRAFERNPLDVWSFVRTYLPTAGDLLLTEQFLVGDGVARAPQDIHAPPRLLDVLQGDPDGRLRMGNATTTDSQKVRTKLFLSKNTSTTQVSCSDDLKAVARIKVKERIPQPWGNPSLYRDGRPDGDPECGAGDGTVKYYDQNEVDLDYISQVKPEDEDFREGIHVTLMGEYATEICAFLNNNEPCASATASAIAAETPTTSVLSFAFVGRVQPFVRTPAKQSIGVLFGSTELTQETEDAFVEIVSNQAAITFIDPVMGDYDVQLTATAGDVFSVNINYADEQSGHEVGFDAIYHDGVITFTVVVDSQTPPTIVVIPPLAPPTNLRSQRVNDLAQLVWDASPDPSATGYNIFARPDDQPKYALLGSTTATTIDTAHPWNAGGSGQAWQYFVVAAAADGKESFFTETIENRHPLIARFAADVITGLEPLTVTFADQSSGEVSAWAWDFDSDGTIDSTAQNPTHLYDTHGSYTITLTVGGPEGTDTTIRAGFITVDPLIPLPPPVPGDFDGDGDVDLLDHKAFVLRMNGPFVDPTIAGWHLFDLDPDYDVDLRDFAVWQNAFTGP